MQEGTDAMKRFFMLAKDDLHMGNVETGISKLNLIASLNPDNNPTPTNSTLYGSVNEGSAQKMLDWTIGINRPSINSLNENSTRGIHSNTRISGMRLLQLN